MKRQKQNAVAQIPPFLDQFGKPTYENPFGRYRPNPALTGDTQPAPMLQPIVLNRPAVVAQPAVADAPAVITAPVIATIATEAPALAAENTAAVMHAPAPERLHLNVHTAAATDALTNGQLAFDTTDPIYQDALARYSEIFGLNTEIETTAPALQTRRLPADQTDRRANLRRRAQRTVAVITAVGGGFVGISAASAYFTSSGSGSGSGTTGTVLPVTATATVSGSPLIPDGSLHAVTVNITNPNGFPLTLNSVIANGTATGTGGKGTCTNADITFAPQNNVGTNLLGGNTVTPVTFNNAATVGTGSQDGCQGAAITVPVRITVRKP